MKFLKLLLVIIALITLFILGAVFYFDKVLKQKKLPAIDQSYSKSKNEHEGKTLLYIIGTRHDPTIGYNADSLLKILIGIEPSVILIEGDSSFFNNDFHFKHNLKFKLGAVLGFVDLENEYLAVKAYQEAYPKVKLRPFDFEGRNAYHAQYGINTKPKAVFKSINELYNQGKLKEQNTLVWKEFIPIDRAYKASYNEQARPIDLNDLKHSRLCEKRQRYKYEKVNAIVKSEPSLKQYRDFYQINSNFWTTRNETMAKNIMQFCSTYENETIVVLTGASHKYFLTKAIQKDRVNNEFVLMNYFAK